MTFGSLPPEPEAIAVAVVALAVRVAVAWQRELSWSEYRAAHGVKRALSPPLERLAAVSNRVPDLPLISVKGGHDDGEYLGTVDLDTRATVAALRDAGHELHLVNSIKQRDAVYGPRGVEYSVAHTRFVHDDGRQTEAYLFAAPDGRTDVYGHAEVAVEDPDGHLDATQQVDGDPRQVIGPAVGV